MQNDAKLGLVAGVAGVVVAGILFAQPPQAPPAAPPAAAKAAVAVAKPAETTSASLPAGKGEVEAQPASRRGGEE